MKGLLRAAPFQLKTRTAPESAPPNAKLLFRINIVIAVGRLAFKF